MAENAPNLVTFKIVESDLEWATKEQNRLRYEAGLGKVSQWGFFQMMRRAYEVAGKEITPSVGTTEALQMGATEENVTGRTLAGLTSPVDAAAAEALLRRVLASNKPGLADAILRNLQQFSDAADLWDQQQTLRARADEEASNEARNTDRLAAEVGELGSRVDSEVARSQEITAPSRKGKKRGHPGERAG